MRRVVQAERLVWRLAQLHWPVARLALLPVVLVVQAHRLRAASIAAVAVAAVVGATRLALAEPVATEASLVAVVEAGVDA